jgi:hypothetical protein
MFAKNLEIALVYLCERSDVSHSIPHDFAARFDALRRCGKLPRGRVRRDQLLTNSEVAAAILGLVPVHPNWAGHAAIILSGLRPIGGVDASFFGTSTLPESIAHILTDATARNSVRDEAKKWFRDKFASVRREPRYADAFRRFAEICANEQPHEYLYKACRVAVAHAGKGSKSDPDDANEVTRLHKPPKCSAFSRGTSY